MTGTNLAEDQREADQSVRVTVVMPTYDQDSFLPGAVASLIVQSEPKWELIVVEDGSPGDTRKALSTGSSAFFREVLAGSC